MLNFLITVSVTMTVHEIGHAVMVRARGLKVKGVHISWKGIGIRRERGTYLDSVYIAAAGPLASLLVAIICWDYPSMRCSNMALGIVSLIPFKNSDGRHIIEAIQSMWKVE